MIMADRGSQDKLPVSLLFRLRSQVVASSVLLTNSPCLLPEVAQIPYSFIFQLRAKQRVGLGQNGYQPTE